MLGTPWMRLALLVALCVASAAAEAAAAADAESSSPGLYRIEGRLMKIERDPDPEWFRLAFITVTGGADTRYGFPT